MDGYIGRQPSSDFAFAFDSGIRNEIKRAM
jgi:hypothetical protein